MTTFNGNNEILQFRCKGCGYQATIDIDPSNKDDMIKLGQWLLQHSADGGDYINIPLPSDGLCTLCGEKCDNKSIVNYTGKPICHSCAISIAKELIKKI